MKPAAFPAISKRRWPPILIGVALVIVLGLAGGAVAIERGWLGETDVEVAPAAPGAPALTVEERAYYDYVTPRLRELAAQARELARLGEEKSRDLFQIQARGARLDELVDEISAYGRAHGIPERFATVGAGFAEGAGLVREAMGEARRGFAGFDWDRVAAAVPIFLNGADRLDEAAAELERLGGAGTPVVLRESATGGLAVRPYGSVPVCTSSNTTLLSGWSAERGPGSVAMPGMGRVCTCGPASQPGV